MAGPHLQEDETAALAAWARPLVEAPAYPDAAAREVARRLGARPVGPGTAEFGVWVPMLNDDPDLPVALEVLLPPDGFDPSRVEQTATFDRVLVPMTTVGQTAWVVVGGVTAGTRDRVGVLYQFLVTRRDGTATRVPDALALSVPFGAFAPAELLDREDLDARRTDRNHFASLTDGLEPPPEGGPPRLGPPTTILQVHVGTATPEGTMASLTRWIDEVADRVRSGAPLEPGDDLWLGYDAVQLMPVEPTIEYEGGPPFWQCLGEPDGDGPVRVRLRRPDMTDWGYDVVISGSAAPNAALLETGRPHELADLASALHRFPGGGIRLIFDVVYGHADNQALGLLPSAWFTGPDMYGQHLDYLNPMVRAQLLEMQRRKTDFGADGLRVDGAQDFTYWNFDEQRLGYDDRYMLEMSDVVQEVAGTRYRPWMIFEDGRPWPRDDWEISSTYRAVTERQPHVVQWGPLTFAHNTPALFTFWITKWWRLREIAEKGSHWISGCANHDTVRRGTQLDPKARINTYLGATLPEVLDNAYDHAASHLLFTGFLPGIPMDFLQSSARIPWSFIRNTDERYAVKVWGEEARFLDWQVSDADYADPGNFTRLKSSGFGSLLVLRGFMAALSAAVALHGDASRPVIEAMRLAPKPPNLEIDRDTLLAGARAWMDDVRDYCVVRSRLDGIDTHRTGFDRSVRAFRRARPWLRDDLRSGDRFDYLHPTSGSVVFTGLRTAPDGSERVALIVTMEGAPRTVLPADVFEEDGDWRPVLVAPGVDDPAWGRSVTLPDAAGVVFVSPGRGS